MSLKHVAGLVSLLALPLFAVAEVSPVLGVMTGHEYAAESIADVFGPLQVLCLLGAAALFLFAFVTDAPKKQRQPYPPLGWYVRAPALRSPYRQQLQPRQRKPSSSESAPDTASRS